jgi:TolA-binding protein
MGNGINSESSSSSSTVVGTKNNDNEITTKTDDDVNRLYNQMRQQLISMQRRVHQLSEIQQMQQQIQQTHNLISQMERNVLGSNNNNKRNSNDQTVTPTAINEPIE